MMFVAVTFTIAVLTAAVAGLGLGLLLRRTTATTRRIIFGILLIASVAPHLAHQTHVTRMQWLGETPAAVQEERLATFTRSTLAIIVIATLVALIISRFSTTAAAALPSVVFVGYFLLALRPLYAAGDGPMIENTANIWLFVYSAAESVALAVCGWAGDPPASHVTSDE